MKLLFDIALTHIRGRLRQTIVSIFGVALGVGFSVAMASLMEGSQRDFVSQLIDAMPHIAVSDETRDPLRQPAEATYDAVTIIGLRPRDDRRGIRDYRAVMAALQGWVPGALAPGLSGQAVVRYGGKDVAMTVSGIDIDAEKRVSKIEEDLTVGALEDLRTAANGLIVGDGILEKLGAKVGANVSLTSPSGVLLRFKIVGAFHTGISAADDGKAYALLKEVQILAERANIVNEIRVRLDDVNQAAAIATRIEQQTGYKSVSWQEANEGLLEAFFIRNVIMYTVVAAILLVAGFGIFNIISTITHEKARDIAILKSLGFVEADMRRLFLLEGLAIGLAGSVLGWALGYSLSSAMSMIEFRFEGPTEMTQLPIYISPLHYAIASAFALFASGIAGYLPARKAARLNPVDIIRGAT